MTGIVLAGGRSSRFGSDKLLARVEGVPLLTRAVSALGPVCDDVIVVVGPVGPEPELPGGLVHRVVRDEDRFEGPLAGVAAGLDSALGEMSVVVAGDMPYLQEEVLREMLRVASRSRAHAVALADAGRVRPVPCVVGTRPAARTARSLLDTGERRLRALLEALGVETVDEADWTRLDPARRTLVDVDEPGDLPA